MRPLAGFALSLAALGLAACSAPGPRLLGAGSDLVRESVRTAWGKYLAAARARDLDGLMQLYTDDCVYVVADKPAVTGAKALRQMEERGLGVGVMKRAFHVTAALRVDGDLAWEMGSVHCDVEPKGEPLQSSVFHFVAMWKLGADRRWRIAYLVGQVEAVLVA